MNSYRAVGRFAADGGAVDLALRAALRETGHLAIALVVDRRRPHHVESVEPRPVVIFYLDTPTSGAGPYASDLLDAFLSALWQAEMRREQEGYDVQGVMMKLRDHSHPRPAQSAVIHALVSVGARVGYMPGHDVGERVELIVGELDPE